MAVAEALGKFKWEVDEQTPDEISYWAAWFKIKADAEKKARDEARAKAAVKNPRFRR